jgi:2-amino-4-hydroxy-6-hydroxymethyldihydropteridine diphosphokinase
MARVYVSIGSNIEREKNVRGAVRALKQRFGKLAFSRVYESRAEGFDGDDFYNLVAAFDTGEPVESVRRTLAGIETAHGRVRNGPRFGPRTLDLDILLYGDLVRHDADFDIPRGEIAHRAYVLGPLAEIAPALAHPETGVSFRELWRAFSGPKDLHPVELSLDV